VPRWTNPRVVVAANLVAIAAGFTGSIAAGMDWLIAHARTGAATGRSLHGVDETVRLADPNQEWAAVRAIPGGAAIASAWTARPGALSEYRACPAGADPSPDEALVPLLHAHHIRAVGIDREDERICLRLARAAALAWTARNRA